MKNQNSLSRSEMKNTTGGLVMSPCDNISDYNTCYNCGVGEQGDMPAGDERDIVLGLIDQLCGRQFGDPGMN
jgi:membrane protease subunit (stomatin/prohibitin family)